MTISARLQTLGFGVSGNNLDAVLHQVLDEVERNRVRVERYISALEGVTRDEQLSVARGRATIALRRIMEDE